MHWLDITILIIILVFVLYGIYRGFLLSVLSLVNTLISAIAAVFLARPFATFIFRILPRLGSDMGGFFSRHLSGIDGLNVIYNTPISAREAIYGADGIGGFFNWLLPRIVGDGYIAAGSTAAEYFGYILASISMVAIACIIIFVGIRIIVAILARLFKKLKNSALINGTDRFIGSVFGLVKGVLIVVTALFVIQFIPIMNAWMEDQIEQTAVTVHVNDLIEGATIRVGDRLSFNGLFSGVLENPHECGCPEDACVIPETPEDPGNSEED